MRKNNIITSLFLVVLIAIFASCYCNSRVSIAPISNFSSLNLMNNSTVILLKHDEFRGYRTKCSGVWINETTILTAYHCVNKNFTEEKEALDTEVKFVTYTEVGASEDIKLAPHLGRVIATDEEHDLALFEMVYYDPFITHSFVNIYRGVIEQGDYVEVIGHSIGMNYSFSNGYIASVRDMTGPHSFIMRVIQTTAPISGGNSGGGMFKVSPGKKPELMGICSFSMPRGTNLGFFIHRNHILDFFFKNKIVF